MHMQLHPLGSSKAQLCRANAFQDKLAQLSTEKRRVCCNCLQILSDRKTKCSLMRCPALRSKTITATVGSCLFLCQMQRLLGWDLSQRNGGKNAMTVMTVTLTVGVNSHWPKSTPSGQHPVALGLAEKVVWSVIPVISMDLWGFQQKVTHTVSNAWSGSKVTG